MKCKLDDGNEYMKSLLKCDDANGEGNNDEEKITSEITAREDCSMEAVENSDSDSEETEKTTCQNKTSDVVFLDASKSKSDCVVLDITPSSVIQCMVFDDTVTSQNTVVDIPATDNNTTIKPYLDSISLSEPYCRVCHCTGDEELISPCYCSGSVKWVHETCLVKWMKSSFKESCELCRKNIEIAKRRKPLSKWKLPSQRPTPVLWVLVFITAIALNLASVVKDASRQCASTPCIVFYAVGCIGVVLGTLFLIYWSKRAKHFVNHWLEQNEEWVVLLESTEKRERQNSDTSNSCNNSSTIRT